MSTTPAINQHWPEQGGIFIGSRLIDGQVHHIVIPGGTEFDHIDILVSRVEQVVAEQAGLTPESLSRFERGRSAEFGARKLLAVLAVLGMELDIIPTGQAGTLDELRRERNQA